MRKNIVVLFVALVMGVNLTYVFTTPLAQTGTEPQAQSKIEREAAKLYGSLNSLSLSERRALFNDLTPEFKAEVWKTHLRVYLTSHPELNEKQREVVLSAIALITPRLYTFAEDSPEWQKNVDEPLRGLSQRFLEVFSRETAQPLLTVLGEAAAQEESSPVLIKKPALTFKPTSHGVVNGDCSCSTRSDWCSGESECLKSACSESSWGCGTFGVYSCNGECFVVIIARRG
ncbi:MAG TPA: bacteriocin fulvocin C-related protein [Pyrinomonadaceae bacterium]|jgi:hypothetical protein